MRENDDNKNDAKNNGSDTKNYYFLHNEMTCVSKKATIIVF